MDPVAVAAAGFVLALSLSRLLLRRRREHRQTRRGQFTVRRCTGRDRAEVVGPLSKGVYTGVNGFCWDYLPYVFDRWLASDTKNMIVAVDREQSAIVGLETISIFDGGQTVMFQALRTRKSHQGRGVAKQLSRHAHQLVKTLAPHAHRLRTTTKWPENKPSVHIHVKQGYKPILYLPICGFELSGQYDARRLQGYVDATGIRQISATALCHLLTKPCNQDLFPQRVMVVDWQAFSTDPETLRGNLAQLEAMADDAAFWVGFEGSEAHGVLSSVSFGATKQVVSAYVHHCSIYVRSDRATVGPHGGLPQRPSDAVLAQFVSQLSAHTLAAHAKSPRVATVKCFYEQHVEFGPGRAFWHSGPGGDSLRQTKPVPRTLNPNPKP